MNMRELLPSKAVTRNGSHRRSPGFSLVELVMVLSIISIMSAIAIPRWTAAMQRYQLQMAAQRIATDIALARSRANFGSAPVTITYNTTAGTYTIVGMNDPDHPANAYTVNLSAAPYKAALTSVSFGGASQLVFDGYGTPTQGGILVVTVGTSQQTVTVDSTSGRTVIQ